MPPLGCLRRFRFRARLGFSMLELPGQRGITPAFGYDAPHPSARGTPTLLICALPGAQYGAVRLPMTVRHRRASSDFPMRPAAPLAAGGRGISRFPCEVLPCVLGVSDRAGSLRVSRKRREECGLPPVSTASAPRSWNPLISRLNTRPAHSPVNASPPTSRSTAHDSGPVWLAKPSPYETSIRCYLAGFDRRTDTQVDT